MLFRSSFLTAGDQTAVVSAGSYPGPFVMSSTCVNPACGPDVFTVAGVTPQRVGAAQVSTITVQGRAVEIDEPGKRGRTVWLTTRERWLLDGVLRRHGAVVPRSELARAVWGASTDDHVLDVTVARLRRQLGSAGGVVDTVPKRGYRVTGEVVEP